MRTTIELSDEHRSLLHSLAAQKGLRGYSKVIQEAVDLYISEKTTGRNGMKRLLKMKGTWDKEETKKFRQALKEIRRNWKIN